MADVTKGNRLRLMGTAEVAKALGWDRAKVSTYYKRGRLPEPVATLASGPIWLAEDVEAMLLDVRRLPEQMTKVEREGLARQLTLRDTLRTKAD